MIVRQVPMWKYWDVGRDELYFDLEDVVNYSSSLPPTKEIVCQDLQSTGSSESFCYSIKETVSMILY